MDTKEIKQAKTIIAKAMGYTESVLEPNYWHTDKWGLSLLHYDTSWEWLMDAIIKVQAEAVYELKQQPYEVALECENLANYLEKNKITIKNK